MTVGGRQAYRVESESTAPGLEGMYYLYRIDLGGGQTLAARTSDQWFGDYEVNKQVLDQMMESLVFTTEDEEPTATPTPTTVTPDAAADAPSTTAPLLVLLTAMLVVVLIASGLTFGTARKR